MEQIMTASELIAYMESLRNESQREVLMGFFKTGPGEYGEGDEFLGLKVPQTREIVKAIAKDYPVSEVASLLKSRWHEVRLCGLLILVEKFEKVATERYANNIKASFMRDSIVMIYVSHAKYVNNWDLVDLSAPKILGQWLLLPSNAGGRKAKQRMLDNFAKSSDLWKQRISMVCTLTPIRKGDPSWCLRYAEMHLSHPHDLMQKAVGWMLREMGKHVSIDLLRDFLRQHAHEMSRTTLRYAIEKMSDAERKEWMNY